MEEKYELGFSSEGLSELLAQIVKLNQALTNLGQNTQGLEHFNQEFRNVDAQMRKSTAGMVQASRNLSQTLASHSLATAESLKNIKKALREVEPEARNFLTNLLKNNNFDRYLSDLNKLNKGHEFTRNQLQKLAKQAEDFNSVVDHLRKDSGIFTAFKNMFGSDAASHLQSKDFLADLDRIRRSLNQIQKVDTSKSLDSLTRQNNRNQLLNDQVRERVKVLRSETELNKLNAAQLGKHLAELRAISTEYSRIQAMPKGAERSSAFREYRRNYGSAAATAASQQSISKALASGDVRAAQLLAQAEGRTLDVLVKQQNVSRNLNQQLEQRLAIAQAASVSNSRQAAQLEAQLHYLREMRNEYLRISALPASPLKSAEQRVYKSRYGAYAASEASMPTINKAIESGESALSRWRQINGEIRNVMVSSRDLHQVWRGMAAGVNQIWLSWGSLLPMAAGLAGASTVFKSLTVGKDFGWQMEQVGVAAEAGSAKVAELSQKILDMGSQRLVQGPIQIAQALKVLTQAGLSASDAFKAIPATLNLALVAGDLSDEDSAKFLAGLRSAFHLNNEDGSLNAHALQEAADQAAMAANVSQTSVGKMTEALKQASSEAARFGLSVTDTSAALSILAKYNIEGSAAGTSLKNFLSDLSGRTAKSTKALNQLGLSIYDVNGMVKPFSQVVAELQSKLRGLTDQQQQQWLKAIFNERGLKTANILLSQSGDEFTKLHNQIARAGENMGYTTTQAARLGDTAQGSFLKMKNSWENTFASIGQNTQGDFKGLMSSLSNFANDGNVRQIITGLTSGFLKLADTVVNTVKVLTPVAPLLTGIAAAAATVSFMNWVGGLGLVSTAVGLVSSAYKSASLATQTFAAIQAGTATTLAGTTGTLAALKTTVTGLFTAMGPIGWSALAVGGFAAYMVLSKKAVIDLSSEIKTLDSSLAAVKTDVLEKFNTTGAGLRLDQKLGLGYKSNFQQYALEAETTIQAFEKNRQRIDAAVQDSLAQINSAASQSSAYRIEQETLLLDRKRTLIQEELTRFDQATQHKNELDTQSAQIRSNLVNDLYTLEMNLMSKRTAMAMQHMQEIQAEAVKTQSLLSSLTDGKRSEAHDRLEFVNNKDFQHLLNPEDKKFKLLVSQGMPANQANALTSSTFTEDELRERLNKLLTPAGLKELKEQIELDPQRTAIYLQNLKIGAENLASISAYKNQTPYGVKRGSEGIADIYAQTLDPNPGKRNLLSSSNAHITKDALPALTSLLSQAEAKLAGERKTSLEVRQSKNLIENPPVLNPASSRPLPTYNSDLGNLEKTALQDTQKSLRDQMQKELAAKGSVSDSLVKAFMDNARALDEISQSEYTRKLRQKQIEAENFLKSKGSAEDKARAQKTLDAIKNVTNKGSELAYQALTSGMTRVTSGFGHRHSPKAGASTYHNGIDLAMPVGTVINAPESGKVIRSWSGGAGGTQMQFQGDSGIIYGMAHLSAVLRQTGDRIERGQALARSGNTGNTTGPHLHLTTTVNGKKVDPRTVKLGQRSGASNALASAIGGDTTNYTEAARDTVRELQMQAQKYSLDQQSKLLEQKKVEVDLQNQLGVITDREKARQEMLLQVESLRIKQAQALAELKSKNVDENATTYKDTFADYQRQIENTQRTFEAAQQAQTNWKVGLKRSYNQLVDESISYGTFAQKAFNSVTDSVISAMQNLAVTGKLNFKSMTASILGDLAKIAMRMAMLKLINVGMSAFGGGAGGSLNSLFARGGVVSQGGTLAYANGGVLHHPTTFAMARGMGLAGEAGPEGILPLTRMANGDLGVQATGGGAGTVINTPVTVSVTINSDGSSESSVDAKGAEGLGRTIGKTIETEVYKILTKETRAGGMFAKG
ncbi:phage tail tape measure protein [Snodgrassella sp. ESL0324]|uniref:phage tail tape measure protein n=1 Tax=Snodgrassella sp. ESL0324 TaxID=2705033 RepID=UPI001581B6C9|nr:phage tail tape measure protein [Snodgrassella sp. ESL0324]NUF08963.1 phage tail tape measure protein [Snodgrassella sp. ESL0324]